MSQAILTLVQSLSISGSYPSSSWIESDLKPLFTTLIKRLDSLHQDLSSNEYSDGLLWIMVGVCLTGLVLWNLAMSVVILQNQRTIRSIGQGLLFVSTKLEIRAAESFPTAKFWAKGSKSDTYCRPNPHMDNDKPHYKWRLQESDEQFFCVYIYITIMHLF